MNCSYKGVFDNGISSVGYDNNYGFDGPYSNAYSLNSRSGRLTAGILPNIYTPNVEGPSTVSGVHASYDRLFFNNGNYDGQYLDGLNESPIAAANNEIVSLPPNVQEELPPPVIAPEPDELSADDKSIITQQPVATDEGTVSVAVEPNPPETIKEQESFIYGGRRRAFPIVSKQKPKFNGVYTAPSKRVNANRKETFTTELNGLKDSQYLHEAFLDTKQEQDQSNAQVLVVVAICFIVITLIILFKTVGCCECDVRPENRSSLMNGSFKPSSSTYSKPSSSNYSSTYSKPSSSNYSSTYSKPSSSNYSSKPNKEFSGGKLSGSIF